MKKLTIDAFKPKYNLDIRPVAHYSANDIILSNYLIDYDVKLSNGKKLQRDFVWTLEQKQELIKSVMKNIEIPNFHVILYSDDIQGSHTYGQKTLKIVDGKQRLSTILDFINNKFPLNIDNVDYYFENFDDTAKYQMLSRFSLKFNIIYEYPDKRLEDKDIIYLFEMVNFAGTQQDIDHMNDLLNSL